MRSGPSVCCSLVLAYVGLGRLQYVTACQLSLMRSPSEPLHTSQRGSPPSELELVHGGACEEGAPYIPVECEAGDCEKHIIFGSGPAPQDPFEDFETPKRFCYHRFRSPFPFFVRGFLS